MIDGRVGNKRDGVDYKKVSSRIEEQDYISLDNLSVEKKGRGHLSLDYWMPSRSAPLHELLLRATNLKRARLFFHAPTAQERPASAEIVAVNRGATSIRVLCGFVYREEKKGWRPINQLTTFELPQDVEITQIVNCNAHGKNDECAVMLDLPDQSEVEIVSLNLQYFESEIEFAADLAAKLKDAAAFTSKQWAGLSQFSWPSIRNNATAPAASFFERLGVESSDYRSLFAKNINALLPRKFNKDGVTAEILEDMESFFDPAFYQKEYNLPYWWSIKRLYQHYFTVGLIAEHRPSPLFSKKYYVYKLRLNGFEIEADDIESNHTNGFLHWCTVGRENKISTTPLFDEEFYEAKYPDLRRYNGWKFLHYAKKGIRENRQPSLLFDPQWYMRQVRIDETLSALGDFLIRQKSDNIDPAPNVSFCAYRRLNGASASLEDLAEFLQFKVSRLDSTELGEVISRAGNIEPLIFQPRTALEANWPPFKHPHARIAEAGKSISAGLVSKRFESVVLIPHCRMSGAARVAGVLTEALSTLKGPVLVINTELSNFEHPEWFGNSYTRLDLTAYGAFNEAERARLLFTIVRGVAANNVFNVNSRAGWRLIEEHGRTLRNEVNIFSYLFTYDLDTSGRKVGYPVRELQKCFENVNKFIFDNGSLRDEIAHRYFLSAKSSSKLVVIKTPASPVNYVRNPSDAAQSSAGLSRQLKVMWAGRFDRQKRVDLLRKIADALPNDEFHVWGKGVLDDEDIFVDCPENIVLHGTFNHLSDIDLSKFDAFLYTSAWDGIPTVLIDIGTSALPIVASNVGGVGELIGSDRGWLIEDVDNVSSYCEALQHIRTHPDEAVRRGKNLNIFVSKNHSVTGYKNELQRMLSEVSA